MNMEEYFHSLPMMELVGLTQLPPSQLRQHLKKAGVELPAHLLDYADLVEQKYPELARQETEIAKQGLDGLPEGRYPLEMVTPANHLLMMAKIAGSGMGISGPSGPVAIIAYLAEWLYEHPEVMSEMVSDPRWDQVIANDATKKSSGYKS